PLGEAIDQLGVLLNIDHLVLARVSLDGERVEVVGTQYNLNKQKRIKTATQIFAYDSRPDIYDREVTDLYRREFAEGGGRGVAGKGDKAAEDIGLAHAGSAVC